MEKEGWTVVRNKNKRRVNNGGSFWVAKRGKVEQQAGVVSTFYFTEFLEELEEEGMAL